MKWFVQVVFEIMAMITAYLTNPIVVLFADEYGNLPKCLRFWQTFDNCLDISWMIYEDCVPDFAKYDFNKHYIYHYEVKTDTEMIPGYVEIIDPNFTLKERFQRYICRLAWVYRNSNYGFSYEVNGRDVDGTQNIVVKDIDERPDRRIWISYVPGNIWDFTWSIFLFVPYYKNSKLKLRAYLGWKMKSITNGKHRCMLAFSINPFRLKD